MGLFCFLYVENTASTIEKEAEMSLCKLSGNDLLRSAAASFREEAERLLAFAAFLEANLPQEDCEVFLEDQGAGAGAKVLSSYWITRSEEVKN